MMSKKGLFQSVAVILIVALITFVIHTMVLNALQRPLFANSIVGAYVGNALVAAFIVLLAYRVLAKQQQRLGYLFLVGSIIKFALFFIVFLPSYKQDGELEHIEFFTFFIPYGVCLIAETTVFVRQLNRME